MSAIKLFYNFERKTTGFLFLCFLFLGIILFNSDIIKDKEESVIVAPKKNNETKQVKGDCCSRNVTPGCSDSSCETTVCQIDPFCCGLDKGKWDKTCVETANLLCNIPNNYCPEHSTTPETGISLFSTGNEWQPCGSVPGTNVNVFIKDKEFCQSTRHIKFQSFDSEECPLFDSGDCICLEWNSLMDIWPILVKGIEQKTVVSSIIMTSLSDTYLPSWSFGVDGNKDGIITVEDISVIENILQKKCF